MATTEAGITADTAVEHIQDASIRNSESIVVEAPKPAEPEQKETEADKFRLLADRLGNELGQLRAENRKLMEQVNGLQIPQVTEEKATFEEDPQTFIEQTIQATLEKHMGPKLQILESDLLQRKSEKFDERVSQSYPDWKETANSQDFADWVQASPARLQMFAIADQQYDTDSAVELLKRFKQDQAESQANQQGALAAAGVVTNVGGDTGSARVYAASEIQALIQDDPEGYKRWMAGDGMKAYQEGRVDQSR